MQCGKCSFTEICRKDNFRFIFYFIYVFVCLLCFWMLGCSCLWRPEEGVRNCGVWCTGYVLPNFQDSSLGDPNSIAISSDSFTFVWGLGMLIRPLSPGCWDWKHGHHTNVNVHLYLWLFTGLTQVLPTFSNLKYHWILRCILHPHS